MKNKLYAILLVLIGASCSSKPETANENSADHIISETIATKEFQHIIGSSQVIILDVRTPGELSGGIIDGAINVDFKSSDFQTKIDEMDKDATYMVYCAGGGRSRDAANLMKDLKFKKVYDLQGGFSQWKTDGLPTKLP
jgi:rhodanese-related sulfurtransferase